MAQAAWSPALFGRAAERAWCTIDAIAARLRGAPQPERRGSLASGDAGIGLFFFYLHGARPGQGFDDLARRRLDRAAAWLAAEPVSAHLHTGAAGVAWALAHTAAETGGGADDDGLTEVDALVERHLELRAEDPHDFVGGLAGLAFYALSRWPRSSARRTLAAAVERLEAAAEPCDDGLCWPVRDAPDRPAAYPLGSVDLGVAHGLPGLAAVLAQIAALGVATASARRLVEGGLSFLRRRRRDDDGLSALPDVLVPGRAMPPARAAWCYGDPGVAAAWHTAALALERADWRCEAAALACRASRRPAATSGVRDASLCHGAAGLGLIFQRLSQVSADGDLAQAASAWYERALHAPPADDPSLLTGAAGVGLGLLAAVSCIEPAWDALLLLSPLHPGPPR
jgi:lantibiotic modifying enzyme